MLLRLNEFQNIQFSTNFDKTQTLEEIEEVVGETHQKLLIK